MEDVVREDSRMEAMVGGGAGVRRRQRRAVDGKNGDAVDGRCDSGDGGDGGDGYGGQESAVIKVI